MKKQLEIAIVKAHCLPQDGSELYWLFGRSQLEFVLKEVELFSSPSRVPTARYRDTMVPVVSLEKHFGIAEKKESKDLKYLVIRAVNEKKEMIKLIIQTVDSVKIHKLETGFTAMSALQTLQNSDDILGSYSLSGKKIVIVPNIAKIVQSVMWQGLQTL